MRILFGAVALAVSLGLPVAARATTIKVTGSVTAITNDTPSLTLDGSVVVGTPFTATYTYDPNLVPSGPPPGVLYAPLIAYQVVLGDYILSNPIFAAGGIRIINNGSPGSFDEYRAGGTSAVLAGSFGGTPSLVGAIFALLDDSSGTAFSSDALQVPDLSQFGTTSWQVAANQDVGEVIHQLLVTGSISSLTQVPVPEPPTLSLVAVGALACLLRLRRRGRRLEHSGGGL